MRLYAQHGIRSWFSSVGKTAGSNATTERAGERPEFKVQHFLPVPVRYWILKSKGLRLPLALIVAGLIASVVVPLSGEGIPAAAWALGMYMLNLSLGVVFGLLACYLTGEIFKTDFGDIQHVVVRLAAIAACLPPLVVIAVPPPFSFGIAILLAVLAKVLFRLSIAESATFTVFLLSAANLVGWLQLLS